MAACDSFMLLLNQVSVDICGYKASLKNFLAVVGAWYTLRFSAKLGCWFVTCLNDARKMYQKRNFVKCYGSWAIVTGCTSGIGNAIALELAAKGMNIVLVARNVDLLKEKAKYLQNMYGVNTIVIVHDFSTTSVESMKSIAEIIDKLDVGILINNVGIHYPYPMEFHNVDVERVHSLVQVNIMSAVAMTRSVLPGMISRKRGLIVNLASSSCQMPFPLIALYSSSKGFLDHFSQALYEEARLHNVHIQSLVPFYISTNMTKFSPSLQQLSIFCPTAETYAKHAVRTFGLYKVNTGYFPHTLQSASLMFIPHSLAIRGSMFLHRRQHKEGLLQRKAM